MTNINGTENDDTLNNAETETVDMISGGDGDDIITNSGTVNNFIGGGNGADTSGQCVLWCGAVAGK